MHTNTFYVYVCCVIRSRVTDSINNSPFWWRIKVSTPHPTHTHTSSTPLHSTHHLQSALGFNLSLTFDLRYSQVPKHPTLAHLPCNPILPPRLEGAEAISKLDFLFTWIQYLSAAHTGRVIADTQSDPFKHLHIHT